LTTVLKILPYYKCDVYMCDDTASSTFCHILLFLILDIVAILCFQNNLIREDANRLWGGLRGGIWNESWEDGKNCIAVVESPRKG